MIFYIIEYCKLLLIIRFDSQSKYDQSLHKQLCKIFLILYPDLYPDLCFYLYSYHIVSYRDTSIVNHNRYKI